MTSALIISVLAFFGIFVLFLVLSKTLNNTVNQLVKLNYLLQKEYDLKKEQIVIEQLIAEQAKAAPVKETDEEEDDKEKNDKTPPVAYDKKKK